MVGDALPGAYTSVEGAPHSAHPARDAHSRGQSAATSLRCCRVVSAELAAWFGARVWGRAELNCDPRADLPELGYDALVERAEDGYAAISDDCAGTRRIISNFYSLITAREIPMRGVQVLDKRRLMTDEVVGTGAVSLEPLLGKDENEVTELNLQLKPEGSLKLKLSWADLESPVNDDGADDAAAGDNVRVGIVVTLEKARGLPAADSNGLSDPYAVLKLNGLKRRSRVLQGTLNPVWYAPQGSSPRSLTTRDPLIVGYT